MTAKVELLTPSGGKVILDPTDTAVDRVLTLPAVAGTVLNTASDIEAQVKTATSATGDAPIFSCRAFVNFNGTGTVAIRASGNVSSITDNLTGNYTVNFTTAMPDADYSFQTAFGDGVVVSMLFNPIPTAGSFNFGTNGWNNSAGNNGALRDFSSVSVAIFR